ncbi:MAG: thiamine pyrophosphate-requiring protein [Chloroflexota bacterium]|nr:thiamine pyrophosphate-requiring protein [Chloroflexota bacterium]MDE2885630.1 thiamine pyrophosphate-requiring protein [Chloroflexota bacterium]
MIKRVPTETVADAYLELLSSRGIDYFFGIGGTDFSPIVEAYARRQANEMPVPVPITVPHETVGVAMAHGYTMVTGRPQVVMVHTVPGTANAVCGVVNASRANVPMLFTAGRSPISEGDLPGARDIDIGWAQESFDQAAMVREWVKWDYELRIGSDVETAVDRALAIATSGPQGPVYLVLPRESLAHASEEVAYSDPPRIHAAAPTAPDRAAVRLAARKLAEARDPLLVTRASGADPDCFAPLIELAEALALPVVDMRSVHNGFPQDHPLHAGGNAAAYAPDADVIVALESDVPWSLKDGGPREDAFTISMGEDPLFQRYPIRGFSADLALTGRPSLIVRALLEEVAAIGVDEDVRRSRFARWQAEHEKRRSLIESRALAAARTTPIDQAWLSYCIGQALDDDTIVLNELGFDANYLTFTKPQTYFSHSPAGGLGWALGAALGAKLATPDRTVVCGVGDGSYLFGAPASAHLASRAYDLPVLWVVFNNAHWGSVSRATDRLAPNGWAASTGFRPFTDITPPLDYEMVCQAAGGYGERVSDPSELPDAIERALNVVRTEKRQALLNVIAYNEP